MRFVKGILLLVIVAFLVLFAAQNSDVLTSGTLFKLDLHWVTWETGQLPLYLLVVGAFLLGGLLMFIYLLTEYLRSKGAAKSLRHERDRLKRELENERASSTSYTSSYTSSSSNDSDSESAES
ncbi:lipopolysaccharide assembly LapA domain-containing protein [Oceanidesulfovibrio marinus]|uniref:LapA family protein n=1 Tax=Oceanidesulfovibrio marinus TaxID=370038 RepID=A0A6P1ZM52_9BACT|nr:LapA family protein [Oceanidesulfovibrio marinus]QJT08112.1 LapA family protein [Oceanidesulfovibrio marinus]TVM35009.1 hypothetical protein DQK91_06275 [Oceanidesulfovibrio marinus]